METPSSLVQFGKRHVSAGIARVLNAVIVSGKGSYVTLDDGRALLDFTCGIAVTNLGHCHPRVSEAAAKQCMDVVHVQCSIGFHGPYLRLIERLLPIMPHPSLDTFFFWNSGAEAVEASIKLARTASGRQNVICMQGGYHGRTFGAMALTRSKTIYNQGVAPLMPGVFTLPFPYWHQLSELPTASTEEMVAKSLHQLQLLLTQQTLPEDTAAIILEPVLGEGGYVPAPPSFLQGIRKVCDKHGILLIFDEVQTGFGRTGEYFACEHSGVWPDIMVMAKGLANGFPLSAIVSRKELMDKQKPGSVGGTYAGNAVSCAAGVAVVEVMEEERTLENVRERSKQLFDSLNEIRKGEFSSHYITDVRGLGLMVGVEFAGSSQDLVADDSIPTKLASKVTAKCLHKGLLILQTSVFEVVRFMPPLNISEEDMAKAILIFREALKEVLQEN